MKPLVLSAHFSDSREAKEVRRAAKLTGQSPSAFLREAAKMHAKEVILEHAKKCPMCGAAT
jgi:uncharacterized protein (DUF1778 family)